MGGGGTEEAGIEGISVEEAGRGGIGGGAGLLGLLRATLVVIPKSSRLALSARISCSNFRRFSLLAVTGGNSVVEVESPASGGGSVWSVCSLHQENPPPIASTTIIPIPHFSIDFSYCTVITRVDEEMSLQYPSGAVVLYPLTITAYFPEGTESGVLKTICVSDQEV